MKVLAISDIHGDKGLAKKIAKKAKKENIDLIVLAGDITWFGESVKDTIKPFADLGKEILILPGNHETNETISHLKSIYPSLINIDKEPFKKNDVGFFGAGYAFGGPFWTEEEQLKKKLMGSHKKIKDLRKKVLITHHHHQGSDSEFSGFPGSEAIRKSIEYFSPDFAIHGHIHEASGIYEKIGKTKIVNVSRKAFIFEI
jgi:uncharacterized protein